MKEEWTAIILTPFRHCGKRWIFYLQMSFRFDRYFRFYESSPLRSRASRRAYPQTIPVAHTMTIRVWLLPKRSLQRSLLQPVDIEQSLGKEPRPVDLYERVEATIKRRFPLPTVT